MKIYLAASWGAKSTLRVLRDELVAQGHEVTSRWLNSESPGMLADDIAADRDKAAHGAMTDLDDIRRSDFLALFTHLPSTTGGFHTEFGFAWALHIPVFLVGRPVSVFHALVPPNLVFEDFREFLKKTASLG